MYLHGYMMFPDYVAVALLIGTVTYLLCLTFYAVIQLWTSVTSHRALSMKVVGFSSGCKLSNLISRNALPKP